MSADLGEWPPPVPRTTEEFNALWDRVVRGEIPDPTPHGMGYDHCPYCFSDWKEPHARDCAYKGDSRAETG
jgi:hypothetical protein